MIAQNIPKISVILPVFNVDTNIRQCLDSIKTQTLAEIEVIIVNDCSTDMSGNICEEYALKDKRFHVIGNERNIGQGLSRNKGIDQAKGEYIGFVDPDDWIDNDYYERLYKAAKANQSDITKTEQILINSEGIKERQPKQNRSIKNGIKNKIPLFLLFCYEHCTAIYKRELLVKNDIKYPNIRNAEDDIFLLQLTYYANSISIISDTYYYYRQHSSSTVSIREIPYYKSILNCFDLKIDFLNTHEMEKKYYEAAFQYVYHTVNKSIDEIALKPGLYDFEDEYVKEAILILKKYKYKEDLLKTFCKGFKGDEELEIQIKKGNTYKIYIVLSKLKSAFGKFFKPSYKTNPHE
jgi:glycosyltransferase EpsH